MALSPTRILSLVPTVGLVVLPALSAAGAPSNAQDELNKRAPIAAPSFTGIIGVADRVLLSKGISGTDPGFNELGDMIGARFSINSNRKNTASLTAINTVGTLSGLILGDTGDAHQGSAVAHVARIMVREANDGVGRTGHREYAPLLTVLRAASGYANFGGNWWGHDNSLAGPIGGTDTLKREQSMGYYYFLQKRTEGTALGTDTNSNYYWGSTGISVATLPITAGGGSQGPADQVETYTMNSLLDLSGYAGPFGTPSGDHANARRAALAALKVGGLPHSVWRGETETMRSRIGIGAHIQDVTDYGILIENPYNTAISLLRLKHNAVGTSAGDFVNAAQLVANAGTDIGLDIGVKRYAAGATVASAEVRLRSHIGGNNAYGAWMAARATGLTTSELAWGRGTANVADMRLRDTGALNLVAMGAAPAAFENGDIYHYNNQIVARLNDANVVLGAPGGFPSYTPAGAAVLNTGATAAADYQLYFYDAGAVVATRINTISPNETGCVPNANVDNGANLVALVNRAIVTGKNVLIDGLYMSDPITHVLPTGAQVRFIGRVGACLKGRSGSGGACYRIDGDYTQEVTWDGIMVDASLRTFVSGAASGTGLNFRKLKRFHVTRSFFYGGVDYTETVGGDSGISATMCLDGSVTLCDFQGWKDKGGYFSGSELTDPSIIRGRYYLDGNVYYRCNTGWSATRQVELIHSSGESFVECLYGFGHTETGTDLLPGGRGVIVIGFYAKKVGRICRLHGHGGRDRVSGVGEDYGWNPLTGAAMPSRQAAFRLEGTRGADIDVSLSMKDWADSSNHAGYDLRKYSLNIGFKGQITDDVLTAQAPDQGFFAVGQAIVGAAAGTYITEDLGGAGGAGNYRVNIPQTVAADTAMTARQTVTGSISGDLFTPAGSPSHGVLQQGAMLSGGTVAAGTVLVKPGSVANTWIVSPSQTVPSTLMTVDQTWRPQNNRIKGRMTNLPLGIGIYENDQSLNNRSDILYDNVGTPVFTVNTSNSMHIVKLNDAAGTEYRVRNNLRLDSDFVPSLVVPGVIVPGMTVSFSDYSSQLGRFERGEGFNIVHFKVAAKINIPAGAAVADIRMTGLPFTAASGRPDGHGSLATVGGFTWPSGGCFPTVPANSAYVRFRIPGLSRQLQSSDFVDGATIRLEGTVIYPE